MLLLGLSMFAINSCSKKENLQENSSSQSLQTISNIGTFDIQINKALIGKHQMLKFNSWEEFDKIANLLNGLKEKQELDFLSNYNIEDMNDDELNVLLENEGFNENEVYEKILSMYDISNSLFSKINSEMKQWLANNELNMNSNPMNQTLFYNGELILLNNKQQIMIGENVFQFHKDGFFLIDKNYAEVLDKIEEDLNNNVEVTSIAGWWVIQAPKDCVLWKSKSDVDLQITDYRFDFKVGIRSIFTYTNTFADVEAYQKKKNGGWKKYKTKLTASLQVETRDHNCNLASRNSGYKSKNANGIRANADFWGGTPVNGDSHRAELGVSICGTFNYMSKTKSLIL